MKTKIIIAVMLGLTVLPTSCRTKNEKKTTIEKEQKNKEDKKMNVKELTLESFKNNIMDYEANPTDWKFKGERPAVIDFYAVWCGPCKATAPILESLAKEYDGQVDFYKVDIDKQQELSTMFDIRSIPTLLFIPKEGKPQMQVGAMDHTQLENAIKSILQK